MKNINYLIFSLALFYLLPSKVLAQNCDATAKASQTEIQCGEKVGLTGYGQSPGIILLDEDFNSGEFGSGWDATPGSVDWSNPCSPGGVDGTTHAWMGNSTTVPRLISSDSYDLSAATAGVTICFDLLFSVQGDNAPCEGPDEADEGVYLQYTTDGGSTWQNIHYFDPNGGNDPDLTNWNNWCFEVPAAAITSNTSFRWFQDNDSGKDFDHWGIDNVNIYINDVDAEVVWLNDNYSYGSGNFGGPKPDSIMPTSDTTWVIQITTGAGDVCKDSVTINVSDPIYDFNLALDTNTVCPGDCANFIGNASWVVDTGGVKTFQNSEKEDLIVAGPVSIAEMDINIQDLNMQEILSNSLLKVCIDKFKFTGIPFGASLSMEDFEVKLTTPDGCEIILAPSGSFTNPTTTNLGLTEVVEDVCFVPVGGSDISTGSGDYSDDFDPEEPFSNLDGCDPEGAWELNFSSSAGGGFGSGSLSGWSITFDDTTVTKPINATWNPTNGLNDPNILNPTACPSSTTTYTLTIDNGNPGCATASQDYTLTVLPSCNGCTPPNITINPITDCNGPIDLSSGINNPDGATLTYYNTQNDAQNSTNPIGSNVNSSGSYWIRAEDPNDATCFALKEIQVTISQPNASFDFPDFCPEANNGPINVVTSGGTFAFGSTPSDGATINPTTGKISDATNGSSYTVEYTVGSGSCTDTHTETVNASGIAYNINITEASCGQSDGEIELTANGGATPYTYSIDNGNTTQNNGTFDNLSAGSYDILITDDNGCMVTGTESIDNIGAPEIDDFNTTDPSCFGDCDGKIEVTVSGGTPPYTYVWTDSNDNVVGGNTNTLSNLCDGDYTVTITDDSGTSGGPGNSTTIYSEDFETGATDWNLNNVISTEGTDPNHFEVSDDEGGVAPGGCGVANNGDATLYMTSSITFFTGAAYNAGGNSETHRRAETPDINTSGYAGLNLSFDYIANGDPDHDTATVWFYDGSGWSQLGNALNSGVCVGGQGLWTAFSEALPSSCENISDLKIAIRWDNNADNLGTDPSVAINNLEVVSSSSGGGGLCSAFDNFSLNAPPELDASFNGLENTYCLSDSIDTLTTTQGGGEFLGAGMEDNLFNPGAAGVGTHTISYVVTNGATCADTVNKTVEVLGPNAEFTATPTETNLDNTEVTFDNQSTGAIDYVWNFGDGSQDETDENVSHKFPDEEEGVYVVTLLATDQNGCSDLDQVTIYIGNPGIMFDLPNIFTPNGDGENDFFKLIEYQNIGEINIVVLNRWGNVVFESDKASFTWNGKVHNSGQECSEGVYFYKANLKDLDGNEYDKNGFVHLVRNK